MNPHIANPIQLNLNGQSIQPVYGFRYGQQLHNQRFFEFKFRQSLLYSPISFATEDPDRYKNQPISLTFNGWAGKQKRISGTIVKLEIINSGEQAEVVITGTMFNPSKVFSKFRLFLIALLLGPFLFIGSLSLYVSNVKSRLIKMEGSVNSFHDHSISGYYRYNFKIDPYACTFSRNYHRPIFDTPMDQIENLFRGAKSYNLDSTGQQVDFYILKSDSVNLNSGTVDFFYLKSSLTPFVAKDFRFDVFAYVIGKPGFYLFLFFYILSEVFCLVCAYYCYRMHALNREKVDTVIWYASLLVAVVLNAAIFLILM